MTSLCSPVFFGNVHIGFVHEKHSEDDRALSNQPDSFCLSPQFQCVDMLMNTHGCVLHDKLNYTKRNHTEHVIYML